MHNNSDVWIVDDDRSIRWVLEKALSKLSANITCFENGSEALARLQNTCPDLIISDIRMPETDGITLLESIKASHPDLPVIIMTAYTDLDQTVSAFQGGAFEFLSKPFDIDEAVNLVKRALSERLPGNRVITGQQEIASNIIGSAPAMQEVFRAIGRLSGSNLTVLITGESGTGKELVARALHRHSPRADQPFIALNTAAIPKELLESELFGHEKGAFTGANTQRIGRFQQADGGTLFLDEIGDMPTELQTRLLRVLADGEFYRVGGHMPIKVDVRVIAATHQNLERMVESGEFREDLLHRLNVIRVHVPSLRQRREDIPALIKHFLKVAAQEIKVDIKQLLPETEALLNSLDWPGNVRQLENFCRWITVMASGRDIHISDLPPELIPGENRAKETTSWESQLRNWAERTIARGEREILNIAIPNFERVMIETALRHTNGRRQEAAALLGWGRNTLTRKIKELKLEHRDSIE